MGGVANVGCGVAVQKQARTAAFQMMRPFALVCCRATPRGRISNLLGVNQQLVVSSLLQFKSMKYLRYYENLHSFRGNFRPPEVCRRPPYGHDINAELMKSSRFVP